MRIIGEEGEVLVEGHSPHDRVRVDGRVGDISIGGNGRHGDLAIYRREASNEDLNRHSNALIHFNGGHADIRAGGNGKNGDLALYPQTAEDFDSHRDATIHLDGGGGNLKFSGRLQPLDSIELSTYLASWSNDAGTTIAVEGNSLWGEVSLTFNSTAGGNRGKLRWLWIFNQRLHRNSHVVVTAHGISCPPCEYRVLHRDTVHPICNRQGWFIDVELTRLVPSGTEIRLIYWIMT